MTHIDTYRKRAKLLMRWHREGNHSIGAHVRTLPRFADITDREVLARPLPLALAQEIVAVEAGFADWATLKAAAGEAPKTTPPDRGAPRLQGVVPIFFVKDVPAAASYYVDKLGFEVDFLHGNPAFYGAVSRDGVCIHLRFVHDPAFATFSAREGGLILASFEVTNVWALYNELQARGAEIAGSLTKEAWGGTNFFVRDPDGNCVSFVTYDEQTDRHNAEQEQSDGHQA
jgi:catechol 2,3-dioxygenase-like lactoylglutathione lyase family enzyme